MARTKQLAEIVVCDAGPLIHLDELKCLELLEDFDRVLLPTAVKDEVKKHRPAILLSTKVFECIDQERKECDRELKSLALTFTLHTGEKQALGLARNEQADLFLTDDSAARLAARALGLEVHGTIGILIRAIRRQQRSRSQVLKLLRSIPTRSSLFVKRSLLIEVINQVNNLSGQ